MRLKVINELQQLGWKPGDTLLYQPEYKLTEEQQKEFSGHKSIKPDIILQALHGNILAVFENEAKKITREDVLTLKGKVEETPDFEPEDKDLETLKEWPKIPEIYLL